MRFSQLDGKRIGVWGAGREIRSLASQLHRRLPSARIAVIALDAPRPGPAGARPGPAGARPDDAARGLQPDPRAVLESPDAELVIAGADPDPGTAADAGVIDAFAACDVVVRSPGVSIYRAELQALRERGVPVTTATSLWLAETGGERTIGVTGTKGKSTTASLIAHLARAAGVDAALAGNIGVPALDLLDKPDTQLYVVELSSYQIADLQCGPEVAVLTNLYREHVDWHGSAERYRADKLRLLALPGVRGAAVNGRDRALVDAATRAVAPSRSDTPSQPAGAGTLAEVRRFGVADHDSYDATADGVVRDGELIVSAAELPLRGEHNALNLCAALTALELTGLPPSTHAALATALRDLAPLPHRLELVAERDGVAYVDDSISTTPESTLAALASFPDGEIVLIAGGHEREQDYTALAAAIAQREVTVIALPDTGTRLLDAARAAGVPASRAIVAADMQAAVARARELAKPGATVLLSPAAPSFNAYADFEARARHFRALVPPAA